MTTESAASIAAREIEHAEIAVSRNVAKMASGSPDMEATLQGALRGIVNVLYFNADPGTDPTMLRAEIIAAVSGEISTMELRAAHPKASVAEIMAGLTDEQEGELVAQAVAEGVEAFALNAMERTVPEGVEPSAGVVAGVCTGLLLAWASVSWAMRDPDKVPNVEAAMELVTPGVQGAFEAAHADEQASEAAAAAGLSETAGNA